MFKSAYIKMTAFYVSLLLILSVLFSIWLYKEATRELNIGLRAPFSAIMENGSTIQNTMFGPSNFDQNDFIQRRIQEGKNRVITNLVFLNIIIVIGGGAASYWLARRTMEPIEQAMEAQNRFTADASHELRTPLTAMKLGTEILLRTDKKLQSETKELLESNLEEIDRLTKLSEDLLLLAQGKSINAKTEVRLDTMAEDVAQRLKPLADKKLIKLKVRTVPSTVHVRKEQIERVITILIDNAVKYSSNKTEVHIELTTYDAYAQIQVSDKGIGISKEDSKHIFERFFRSDTARTHSDSSGHGLGLPIAHKIITEHGGAIQVVSDPGEGSTFTIRLPLKK